MLKTNLKPSEFGPNTQISVLGWGLGVGVLKELESDIHRTAWGGGGKNWLREKGKELASTEHILRFLSCSCHP